jgi:hypothetical protein
MAVARACRRVVGLCALFAGALLGVGLSAIAAGAATEPEPAPPITEIVPVRIHGHDSSWPPVLIFCAIVVVGGGIFVCVVFMRRAGAALRAGRPASPRD